MSFSPKKLFEHKFHNTQFIDSSPNIVSVFTDNYLVRLNQETVDVFSFEVDENKYGTTDKQPVDFLFSSPHGMNSKANSYTWNYTKTIITRGDYIYIMGVFTNGNANTGGHIWLDNPKPDTTSILLRCGKITDDGIRWGDMTQTPSLKYVNPMMDVEDNNIILIYCIQTYDSNSYNYGQDDGSITSQHSTYMNSHVSTGSSLCYQVYKVNPDTYDIVSTKSSVITDLNINGNNAGQSAGNYSYYSRVSYCAINWAIPITAVKLSDNTLLIGIIYNPCQASYRTSSSDYDFYYNKIYERTSYIQTSYIKTEQLDGTINITINPFSFGDYFPDMINTKSSASTTFNNRANHPLYLSKYNDYCDTVIHMDTSTSPYIHYNVNTRSTDYKSMYKFTGTSLSYPLEGTSITTKGMILDDDNIFYTDNTDNNRKIGVSIDNTILTRKRMTSKGYDNSHDNYSIINEFSNKCLYKYSTKQDCFFEEEEQIIPLHTPEGKQWQITSIYVLRDDLTFKSYASAAYYPYVSLYLDDMALFNAGKNIGDHYDISSIGNLTTEMKNYTNVSSSTPLIVSNDENLSLRLRISDFYTHNDPTSKLGPHPDIKVIIYGIEVDE